MYIYVQNFHLKVELKACLKEYQFTIVNDCELHLHLTLVLSTALNKEHTMTIYVNLQNYLHTRFMKCYRWILFKAMTILGCCNFDLYPLGTLKFCFNFFEDIKKRKIQAKDFVYKIRWSMHCKVQFIKYIKIYMDINYMWTQENISETAKEQKAKECMRKETKPIKLHALSQLNFNLPGQASSA